MAEEQAPEGSDQPVSPELSSSQPEMAGYQAPDVDVDAPEEGLQTERHEAAESVSEWDDASLEQAKFYGFSEDEAKAFGSRELFEKATIALDRQAAQFGREQLKAYEGQEQQAPAEQPRDANGRFLPREQASPQAPETPTGFEKLDLSKFGVNDEWDEDTVKLLNGLNDHYDGTIRQLLERNSQQEQLLAMVAQQLIQTSGKTNADESQSFVTEMDSFFDGLGEEFGDLFGKGPVRLLAQGSPELSNRSKLLEEMRVLDIADAQANRPRQSYKDLAQRAVRSLHYDRIKTSARKEVEKTLKERQGQQLNRASGFHGKQQSKRDAALARVEQAYREKGFRLTDWDDEEIEV
jgi:hypothetical protein